MELSIIQAFAAGITLPAIAGLYLYIWKIDRRLIRVETLLNGQKYHAKL